MENYEKVLGGTSEISSNFDVAIMLQLLVVSSPESHQIFSFLFVQIKLCLLFSLSFGPLYTESSRGFRVLLAPTSALTRKKEEIRANAISFIIPLVFWVETSFNGCFSSTVRVIASAPGSTDGIRSPLHV